MTEPCRAVQPYILSSATMLHPERQLLVIRMKKHLELAIAVFVQAQNSLKPFTEWNGEAH